MPAATCVATVNEAAAAAFTSAVAVVTVVVSFKGAGFSTRWRLAAGGSSSCCSMIAAAANGGCSFSSMLLLVLLLLFAMAGCGAAVKEDSAVVGRGAVSVVVGATGAAFASVVIVEWSPAKVTLLGRGGALGAAASAVARSDKGGGAAPVVVTAAVLLLGSLFVSTTLYLTRSSSVSSETGIHCWTVKLRAKLLFPGGRSTRIHRRTGSS